MPNRLDTIPNVLLMGPGPSSVLPEVYRALARPTLGHLDPDFIALMDETKDLLRQVMQTQNAVTFPLSGTGSAGMEAAFANLVEPGDRVLILVNGFFGLRMENRTANHVENPKQTERRFRNVRAPASRASPATPGGGEKGGKGP